MAVRIDDRERRARLVVRHHLARTARDAPDATRGVVAMHSSDPLTPHLAVRARVAGFATADLDRALYEERELCRVHAMRRTLWVVPADDVGVLAAAAGDAMAARERLRLVGWLEADLAPEEVDAWLARLRDAVLAALREHGSPLSTRELTARVPGLATKVGVGAGKWATRSPISSRLLLLLAMEGDVVRARPSGSWRSSRYGWALAVHWLGERPPAPEPATARAELARRYLATFGPVTASDLRWWTGWTARDATAALDALGAVAVRLDDDGTGWVLPGDVQTGGDAPRHVALLPGLDPTTMGWKDRGWYLGPHGDVLFDRNGNAGPTVWVDGRVVGGWAQTTSGRVVTRLLEELPAESAERVRAESEDLEAWLGAARVTPRFRTPLERALAAAGA